MTGRRSLVLVAFSLALPAALAGQQPPSNAQAAPTITAPGSRPFQFPHSTGGRWAGFYFGGNGGGNWSQFASEPNFNYQINQVSGYFVPQRGTVIIPGTTRPFPDNKTNWVGKFAAGFQAGYNVQSNRRVWGLEADVDFTSHDDSLSSSNLLPLTALTSQNLIRLHRALHTSAAGSVRLRAGQTWNSNLIYVTGGLAMARGTVQAFDTTYNGPSAEIAVKLPNLTFPATGYGISNSQLHVGYALGAGVERAWSDRFGIALEYRYADYGAKAYDVSTRFDPNATLDPNVARASIVSGPHRIRITGNQLMARVNIWLPRS